MHYRCVPCGKLKLTEDVVIAFHCNSMYNDTAGCSSYTASGPGSWDLGNTFTSSAGSGPSGPQASCLSSGCPTDWWASSPRLINGLHTKPLQWYATLKVPSFLQGHCLDMSVSLLPEHHHEPLWCSAFGIFPCSMARIHGTYKRKEVQKKNKTKNKTDDVFQVTKMVSVESSSLSPYS